MQSEIFVAVWCKNSLKFETYVNVDKYKNCNYIELYLFFTHFRLILKNVFYIFFTFA